MECGRCLDEKGNKRVVRLHDIIPDALAKDPANPCRNCRAAPQVSTLGLRELCGAMRVLHEQGLIHRDLKPSNILLKRGAGATVSVPFILDFNSSVRQHDAEAKGGTNPYLPPEVRSGSRKAPDVLDDLWAVARVLWEMFFGLGRNLVDKPKPHDLIVWQLPDDLVNVLRKALTPNNPATHYGGEAELYDALTAAISSAAANNGDEGPSFEELAHARERAPRLRDLVTDELAGENELPVPKEIQERVKAIYSYLPKDATQSLSVEADLTSLGPPRFR